MELSEFLLARIAEDEAGVKSRDTSRPIHFVGCYYYENTLDANLYCDCDEDGAASRQLLAECDAKRRIVAAYLDERSRRDIYQRDDAMAVEDDKQRTSRRSSAARTRGLEIAVQALALPYADHPDYRVEWSA